MEGPKRTVGGQGRNTPSKTVYPKLGARLVHPLCGQVQKMWDEFMSEVVVKIKTLTPS